MANSRTSDFDGRSDGEFLAHNTISGQFVVADVMAGSAQYSVDGGYGPEWNFVGSGDYRDDDGAGSTQFVLHNTNTGQNVVGSVSGGQASYRPIAGVGNEWTFEGSGNLNGNGGADLLLHNSQDGHIVVGSFDTNSQLNFTTIGGVGNEWDFGGQKDSTGASLNPNGLTGDFLSDGKTGFMLHNTQTGALVIGEDNGGQAAYTTVGYVGNDWEYAAAGNFVGLGKADLLLHNLNTGEVSLADISNGQASYTDLHGGYGSEWQAVGSGDYLHDGHTGVLLHSTTTGALSVMEANNGQLSFTQVGGVGNEWKLMG